MEKIKNKCSMLSDTMDVLLDACLATATGREKQKLKMLKSSKKLMGTTSKFLTLYTQPKYTHAFTEEEFEYLHHFFEAMCESIENFQKEVVPLKE